MPNKHTIIHNNEHNTLSTEDQYMNPNQMEYFKTKLLKMREELLSYTNQNINESLHNEKAIAIDSADAASQELDVSLELNNQSRRSKTLQDIEHALTKIEDKNYGYCEDTGEKIGIKRLEVMPMAKLSVKAQAKHDIMDASHIPKEDE